MDAEPKEDFLTRNDPLLIPFIEAADERLRLEQVETLVIKHAAPLIRRIVARCARSDRALREQDADDVISTVTLRLVRKLRFLVGEREAIGRFDDYVATLTYNTVYDFLRRRFPERSRLKNRLRYVLTRDPRFSLWNAPSGMAAGLAEWGESSIVRQRIELPEASIVRAMRDREAPAEALLAIFRHVGAPVSLDALTDLAAALWRITDSSRPLSEPLQTTEPAPLARAEARQFVKFLWHEIQLLRPPHRAALLLNLRDADGINAIPHFVLLGIARYDEIADALDMAPEELARIWSSLPLDDLKIAKMLQVTRQQVINFRRTARERLARRMIPAKTASESRQHR